jgi:hypothetical protein
MRERASLLGGPLRNAAAKVFCARRLRREFTRHESGGWRGPIGVFAAR